MSVFLLHAAKKFYQPVVLGSNYGHQNPYLLIPSNSVISEFELESRPWKASWGSNRSSSYLFLTASLHTFDSKLSKSKGLK